MFVYKTKDLDEAAFLWIQKEIEMVNTEQTTGFKKAVIWFNFNVNMDEESFQKLRADYINHKTLVEPRAYANAQKDIKLILRDELQYHNNK